MVNLSAAITPLSGLLNGGPTKRDIRNKSGVLIQAPLTLEGEVMEITSLTGLIPVYLPGKEFPIKASLSSNVHEGITISIVQSANALDLHQLIADGNFVSLSFNYAAVEKVKDD
jgi:hypothetical protein